MQPHNGPMIHHTYRRWFLCSLACSLASGCATNRPTAANFSVRRIDHADQSKVLDAAVAALVENGFQIDRVDRMEGVVTTLPAPIRSDDRASQRGRRLSADRSTRRIGYVLVEQEGTTCSVYCKIVVQRSMTEIHRLMALDQSGGDLPTDTAIDRGAASTREQNMVWEPVRRDRTAERRIHASTLERLGRAAPKPNP